ncbi:DNA-methyltransferase [Halobellus limi]|uniref:Type II methyltransferase n=1 Tax=Halobellus limi TaxID=699433 RepID=A0A1H5UNP1_9EURY|nr:site-specific DNA-methyltransferase [Halobellus limi]QCC46978.1 site-specific DNA-methyltransferase [Halobellus limi]SEF76636.1 DNA methylase [Halobellus limi]
MESRHRIRVGDASDMSDVAADAVDLVVTSPPYPMIEMWDEQFAEQSPAVAAALEDGDGERAFEAMHECLDGVWNEVARVLVPGGIAAVVVGDATRTFGGRYRVYPNHARVIEAFESAGFDALPDVLWRKPTNAASKFLGSGMVPPNAYVTLEHEHVLLFRNGSANREFDPGATRRYESAYFWEERNRWFSDVWTDVRGTSQERTDEREHGDGRIPGDGQALEDEGTPGDGRALDNERTPDDERPSEETADAADPPEEAAVPGAGGAVDRERTGAYPFEIPYRLVCMHSLYGDTVLDPFLGTGTTTLAAMVAGRDSVGYELDPGMLSALGERVGDLPERSRRVVAARLDAHRRFVREARADGLTFDYEATHYDFPVRTRQERDIRLRVVDDVQRVESGERAGDVERAGADENAGDVADGETEFRVQHAPVGDVPAGDS